MSKVNVGDKVRSYDFEDKRDCYIEGYVTGLTQIEGCTRYVIKVDREIWRGQEIAGNVPGVAFPPVNGTRLASGGLCNGVEVIPTAHECEALEELKHIRGQIIASNQLTHVLVGLDAVIARVEGKSNG